MDLGTDLEEIRFISYCGKSCKGCDFFRHCDYCGEDFCGCHRYEEGDWAHDKQGDVMCPDCRSAYPEQICIESLQ